MHQLCLLQGWVLDLLGREVRQTYFANNCNFSGGRADQELQNMKLAAISPSGS